MFPDRYYMFHNRRVSWQVHVFHGRCACAMTGAYVS